MHNASRLRPFIRQFAYTIVHKEVTDRTNFAVDKQSGVLGKVRARREDRTQDHDRTGHVEEMASEGRRGREIIDKKSIHSITGI